MFEFPNPRPLAFPTCESDTHRSRCLTICMYLLESLNAHLCDLQAYQAVKGSIDSYDALADLLQSIEHFLTRLDIYTKPEVTPTVAMSEMIIKILVELLYTLALATKQIKEGRSSESVSGEILYYLTQRKHRENLKETLWWREGRRGETPKARPAHLGRGSDNCSGDFRRRLWPLPDYESRNGR